MQSASPVDIVGLAFRTCVNQNNINDAGVSWDSSDATASEVHDSEDS